MASSPKHATISAWILASDKKKYDLFIARKLLARSAMQDALRATFLGVLGQVEAEAYKPKSFKQVVNKPKPDSINQDVKTTDTNVLNTDNQGVATNLEAGGEGFVGEIGVADGN